ncbi:DUF4238 domain-containing protein [Candidatus Saccharibacteria bacterium]|nr:DUF4238 domain-containing protein [Candidatus Saccharibacteria bacterium]
MPQHHFVPQTYLRGFATDDDEDRVFFHDVRVKDDEVNKRLIEDVCSQNNLYKLLMDDNEYKDDLEDTFATVAEPKFREVRDKLLAKQNLSYEDKSEFSAYIALQIMRTPANREIYSSMSKEMWDRESKKYWQKLLDDDAERERVFEEVKKQTGTDPKKIPTKEDIQGIIDGTKFKTEWTIPKENWIIDTMEIMQELFRAFEKMHWRIYFAPRGTAFITTDNPVSVLLQERSGWMVGHGYLAPNAIRFFPLSKNACLAIHSDAPNGFSFETATKRRVQQINGVTVMSRFNIVIGHNKALVQRQLRKIPDGFNLVNSITEHQRTEIQNGLYD